MAFSIARSKSQDSPTFWLSLTAGSLVVHLVLLLVGRWYFSQTAIAPTGTGQAPLDFVEIDPNVSPSKDAKPIAPSNNTQTQAELPKAAPSQETEATQAPNSIANLPRQIEQARSQPRITPSPSPSPTTPINQPNRFQPTTPQGQLPTERPKPTRSPSPTTSPRPTAPVGGSNASPTSPTGGANPDGANLGSTPSGGSNPSQQNPETSGGSATPNPGNTSPSQSESSSPIGGGTSLSGEATFQGKIAQALERDPYEMQRDGALSITVRDETIQPITLTFPPSLAVKELNLRVLVVMDRDGIVVKTEVRDDSPSFLANPELKDPDIRGNVQGAVDQIFMKDKLFEVKAEANTTPEQLFSRIVQLRLQVSR
ncbi:hypothetical protein IQ250_23865 [Pseudanabaenaceae cyanobacterium LEGE 13415]|nr:hypothetical protein [Pseudanabaenaceae cyanobacterium LEGE 13415]